MRGPGSPIFPHRLSTWSARRRRLRFVLKMYVRMAGKRSGSTVLVDKLRHYVYHKLLATKSTIWLVNSLVKECNFVKFPLLILGIAATVFGHQQIAVFVLY
jgi:hypothetical protein